MQNSVSNTSAGQIESWLVERIADLTSAPGQQIYPQRVFDEMGLDSVLVVQLVGDLEDWLGHELSPTLAYEYPTIASLSEHLSGAIGVEGK